MALTPAIRSRLEMQGYCGLEESLLEEVAPWIRFSPAVCLFFIVLGTALASPVILWALAATALFGAVTPRHPFDYVYNHVIRHWTGTRPLPENAPARRFACFVALVWLTATGLAFQAGAAVAGYILGGSMAVAAGLVTFTHFCVASLIYQKLFGGRREAAGGGLG